MNKEHFEVIRTKLKNTRSSLKGHELTPMQFAQLAIELNLLSSEANSIGEKSMGKFSQEEIREANNFYKQFK